MVKVNLAYTPPLHRVGDYVFFESSASGPFAIRRIEELNKTATGIVRKCFYQCRLEMLLTTQGTWKHE